MALWDGETGSYQDGSVDQEDVDEGVGEYEGEVFEEEDEAIDDIDDEGGQDGDEGGVL